MIPDDHAILIIYFTQPFLAHLTWKVITLCLLSVSFSHFKFFSETHLPDLAYWNPTWPECLLGGTLQILSIQCCDQKFKMAVLSYNMFWLTEILQIFYLETTGQIWLWCCSLQGCQENFWAPGQKETWPLLQFSK